MKINLIRIANSLDPKAPYLKDSESFLIDVNNELFEYGHELVENLKKPQFSIIFVETGGSEQKFVKMYESLPSPIILLSNSRNNSLAACFEIKSFLASKKIPNIVIYGSEKDIAIQIDRLSETMAAKNFVDKSNLGVIGAPSDWLIASKVDYKKVKDNFNINLIDIPMEELYEEISKKELCKIPHESDIRNKYKDQKALDDAFIIYSALKRLVSKYKLTGLTLRCFDLIEKYKATACLAFALLNEERVVATCEGDIPTLITMLLVNAVSKVNGFQANPSSVNFESNSVLLSHCTIPLNMCEKYELDTHFESGLGIGVKGTLYERSITVVKIAPNLDNAVLIEGKIIENTNYKNYCRTQINVKFEENDFFDFISQPFGNHVVISYGNIIPLLIHLLQIYKLIPVTM